MRAMLRAAAATVEIVGFSACAHAAADGAVPTTEELVWVSLGVFAATALLFTGRLRMRTVFALCTALQVGLHLAYATAGPSPMPGMATMPAMHATPSGRMVVAHVVSAVVTALVLLVQDRAVRRLGAIAVLGAPVLPPARRPSRLLCVLRVNAGIALVRIAPTRGPPRLAIPTTS